MIDLFAKVYLNEVVYASAAKTPFMMLSSRFLSDEQMIDFLTKFITICLSLLLGLEKNAEELQKKH